MLAAALMCLAGCSSAVRWNEPEARPPAPRSADDRRASRTEHTVRAGDSLYAIALRYGLDPRDIARWNDLGDGELIFPGQRLKLTGPAAVAGPADRPAPSGAVKPPSGTRAPGAATGGASSGPAPRFAWPAKGAVRARTDGSPSPGEGIDIAGKVGDSVVAAAAGRVVYSGSGLIGYGNLIIVKHDARYLTAYGYNDKLLVKEGDQVAQGERIARMGRGPDREAALHFEIRLDGQPVDPMRYLRGAFPTQP